MSYAPNLRSEPVFLGIDVGSTTVKMSVVDPASLEILWSDYQRHQTKQPEMVREFLVRIAQDFPNLKDADFRVFITGSGAGPLAEHLGAKFVQEVNAVTLAVEHLHPDVGSVIELGGQDAKIIMFKQGEDGEKTPNASSQRRRSSAFAISQTLKARPSPSRRGDNRAARSSHWRPR